MKTEFISRHEAKTELLEKSHFNIIQIEKILGDNDQVSSQIVELAIQVSRKAEDAAGPGQRKRQTSVGATETETRRRIVPIGTKAASYRSRMGKPVRVRMGKGIQKAVSFVNNEALV